ncbi:LOW QUALITY PROTEIN: nuclear receptor-interacting protein 1 [Rhinoraja longicauda]
MTHGEDLSSDMQQDSVVLTYLESVPMRRAANAGAPADKSDCDGRARAGRGAEGAAPSPSLSPAALARGLPPAAPSCSSPPRAANPKKARLLQSEDWHGAHKRRRVGGQEGSVGNPQPAAHQQQQTRSTLLASLLQSFSSSLQEHGCRVSTPDSRTSSPEQGGCGRPGALLDLRGGGVESSLAANANAKPSPRLSCSARLKEVASMVGKGATTPGPGASSSPKPSAACSQLALLLSSDCQLQQYSRARSLAPSASQRLAAIACKKQAGVGPERPQAGKASVGAGTPPRERGQRSPASPASAAGGGGGSSLLMHLLNSPKLPATNGHLLWGQPGQVAPPARARPLKEEGAAGAGEANGGGEPAPRSTCTPMDLSTRPRACDPTALHPGSLEQMTESLLFSWNPRLPGLRGPGPKAEVEDDGGEGCGPPEEAKSHHKVTLLQLLLGTQAEPGGEAPQGRGPALSEPYPAAGRNHHHQPTAARKPTPRSPRRSQLFQAQGDPLRKASRRQQQQQQQQRPTVEPAKGQRFLEQGPETPRGAPSFTATSQAPPPTSDSRLANFSFSASKLLHDLAHTGNLKSPEPAQAEAEARAPGTSPQQAAKVSPLGGYPRPSEAVVGPERAGAPDLAQLLERRSVLQLLLRHPDKEQAHKAQPPLVLGRQTDNRGPGYGQGRVHTQVKIKMEPADEDGGSFPSAECPLRAAPRGAGETVKLESAAASSSSCPPSPAHSAARGGGVLSRLLLHHSTSPNPTTEAYPASPAMTRIRHLLPASPPPERRDSMKKPGLNNGHSFCPSNGVSEEPAAVSGRSNGGAPERRHHQHHHHHHHKVDAPEFNVLKQLLLSENGIKVLSQNGGPARESNHHHQRNHHHHPAKPPDSPPLTTPPPAGGHFYQLTMGGKESPLSVELAGYPRPARLPQQQPPPPQRPTTHTHHHHDPPWLTKANPILYYMLRRSAGEAQAFGLAAAATARTDAEGGEEEVEEDKGRRGRRRTQLLGRAEAEKSRAGLGWVKQEPEEESLACFRPHPGQPAHSPGQILEKVAAIKPEPD